VALVTASGVAGWRFIDPVGTSPVEDQPPTEQAAGVARRVRLRSASLGALAVAAFIPLMLAN
jgi:hypothetical protein